MVNVTDAEPAEADFVQDRAALSCVHVEASFDVKLPAVAVYRTQYDEPIPVMFGRYHDGDPSVEPPLLSTTEYDTAPLVSNVSVAVAGLPAVEFAHTSHAWKSATMRRAAAMIALSMPVTSARSH